MTGNAGYNSAWILFDASVCHVMRAAACDQGEAIRGIAKACEDGQIASRYAPTHELIDPVSWRRLAVGKGYIPGKEGGKDVLIAIIPRPSEVFAPPLEAHGPTAPDDGVPRIDRGWSYPPVELRCEDLERLWPTPPDTKEAPKIATASASEPPRDDSARFAALEQLRADGGDPVELRRVLHPWAEVLENQRKRGQLPNTEHVRIVCGLCWLSEPNAISLVEGGNVPLYLAALVGNQVRDVFVNRHPPEVSEDFQIKAMARLAEGTPVSEKFASLFKNPVEEVANEVINEQKAKQHLVGCENLWRRTFWSRWTALSWVEFRQIALLCEDRHGLLLLKKYTKAYQTEPPPWRGLLDALQKGELKAIRGGQEIDTLYWADKQDVDDDVVFRRADVCRCWRGQGEEPVEAAWREQHGSDDAAAQPATSTDWSAIDAAKPASQSTAAPLKKHAAVEDEPPVPARGHYAAVLDMLEGRKSAADEALDRALAADMAAAKEQLKIDLTPEREAALRDLATGEGDVKAIIELLRPVPHLLDLIPQTPRVLAVRELIALPPNQSGYDDDPYWTPGQMILWAVTGDRWTVDQASTDSRPGWFSAQERARNVINALALPRDAIAEAAERLRKLCLSGDIVALDDEGDPIPLKNWINMGIVFSADNDLIVRRRGQTETDPGKSILFPRAAAAKLRSFPAGQAEPSSDAEIARLKAELRDERDAHYSAHMRHAAEIREEKARRQEEVKDLKGESIRALLVKAFDEAGQRQQEQLQELRTRRANEFNRKQGGIPLEKRRWFRLTEVAKEYAKISGALEIDEKKRDLVLEELQRSIVEGEFNDERGRSRVLLMYPSHHAVPRFDTEGATDPDRFKKIADHLWIRPEDCAKWFTKRNAEVPRRLRRATASTPEAEATRPVEADRSDGETEEAAAAPPKTEYIRTGMPGRPSDTKTLILDEHERRIQDRTAVKGLRKQADKLWNWLKEKHPTAQRPAIGTIENLIRDAHGAAGLTDDSKRGLQKREKSRAK